MASKNPDLLGTIGGYELLAPIKSGGMGQVSVGRKRGAMGFERLVAVKTMREDLGAQVDFRDMFLDEARLLARIDHPAVAQVSDFGEENGRLFLVMEYVRGVVLSDLLKRGYLPLRAACELLRAVCLGLHASHEAVDTDGRPLGVVHRDISPQNILLSFEGAPKIIDFGIALTRDRSTPVTEYGQVKGKPEYMAPEQFKQEDVDRRADIFSTGVVLYECLTGRRLFKGNSSFAVMAEVCSKVVEPPSTIRGEVPPEVDGIVMKALERDRSLRFATAREMAGALGQVIPGLTDEAWEPFVQRALQADRENHRTWLAETLRGVENTAPIATPAPRTSATLVDRFTPARGLELWGWRGAAGIALLLVLVGIGVALWPRSKGPDVTYLPLPVRVVTPAPILSPSPLPSPAAESSPQPAAVPEQPPATTSRIPSTKTRRLATKAKAVVQAPADVQPATFSIVAEPYALVRLDGRNLGTTPLYNVETTTAPHVLEVLHPESGAVRWSAQLRMSAGENRMIRVPSLAK